VFTSAEIDALEDATAELERLCLMAVERVVAEGLYDRFGLDDYSARLVDESWRRFDKNLYGRFDLAYDGKAPPKLLEYNADTPTALFEASVVQWEWLQTLYPTADQFNSIHEKLIDAWRNFAIAGTLHFTCVRNHDEDRGTVDYLRDTAMQAGLDTRFLHIDELGWAEPHFVDTEDATITTLFKLYPWEWLLGEGFAPHLGPSGVQLIEPPWKMILSNKAVLPLLWEMFPEHPNLLAASMRAADLAGSIVEKPALGREGQGVRILRSAGEASTAQGGVPMVYQSYSKLPEFTGQHAVIGSWVIASQPAGIGIREDGDPITRNTSRFVPHLFR
jgi:glutathionylspermidine synthase